MQVETIGNVYMVVGGAPTRYESHVKDILLGTYICDHDFLKKT
jgi:hypothetical protein